MVTEVSFQNFIDTISLTTNQEHMINNSANSLVKRLSDLNYPNIIDIQFYGSYSKGTMIRPPYDVDLLAVLDYEDYIKKFLYIIPYDDRPKPISLMNNLRKKLMRNYPRSDVRTDRPCVTIDLSTHSFDITPAFKVSDGYEIPNDSVDGWKVTNPVEFRKQLDLIDQQKNYRLKPFIKMIKRWKTHYDLSLESYEIEIMASDLFQDNDYLDDYNLAIFKWFEELAPNKQWTATLGIGGAALFGLQGAVIGGAVGYLIDKLNEPIETDIYKNSFELAKQAYNYSQQGNYNQSCLMYKEIFGHEFPIT